MKKSELLARIEELEKRVTELEARTDIDVTITNKTSAPKRVGVTVKGLSCLHAFVSSDILKNEMNAAIDNALKRARL
jgi:hypothetical protein